MTETAEPTALSIQDEFLKSLCKNKMLVNIYLKSGIKLQGRILSFDDFVIVLSGQSGEQTIYKHAISTVLPTPNVLF